ncbi:MAG: hypothetical protein ACE5GC_05525 [Acidimicrobiia bacterium]
MDTTLPPQDVTDENVTPLIDQLSSSDPAAAPDIAATIARVLARDLDAAAGTGDPEQLRASFEADPGSG